MSTPVYILWLEHIDPELLSVVPSLQRVATDGVDIQLTPQPLTESGTCYYQLLTGMEAGKFGRFDRVKPVAYQAELEDGIPDGAIGRLLPDMLLARGLFVTTGEAKNYSELDVYVRQASDCVLVRVSVENDAAIIEDLVKRCLEHLSADAHLLVLTDVWHEVVAKYVNINNFLADIGLLEVGSPRGRESIVWAETLAYFIGSGQIWINLRGRESQGCVAAGREYQQVCEALQQELLAWRDPENGAAIIRQVLKKEDIYTGAYLFKAPDLIVEFQPGYAASPQAAMLDFDTVAVYATGNSNAEKIQAPYARLIARGPNFVHEHCEIARLVDFVPNVMYLLGQPVPSHLDGRVISTLFTSIHRQQHPQEYIEDDEFTLTTEEEGYIEERLRALGYIG